MKIFINYRRDDSAGHAGHLFEHLRDHFGVRNVFMDIDTIAPGVDFRSAVQKAVGACEVVLVMIGRQWLYITDEHGQRRLDNPQDWVRVEIASALTNTHVRVIPVLVRGAAMPGSHELPDDLRELAWRNAFELSDNRFRYDANRLISMIEEPVEESSRIPWLELLKRFVGRFWRIGLAVIVPLLLLGIAAIYILANQQPQLEYHVRNQLAQSIEVSVNENEYQGLVKPGQTSTFTRLSAKDFPLTVHWQIKKIGSFGDAMEETIRIDAGKTIIVDNQIGQATYFHPVISSTLNGQCRISINDATKNEAPAGYINGHSRNVTPGYFLWRDDSNVTLYCHNQSMWFGIRKGDDSSRFWSLPELGNGNLRMTFFMPGTAP